MLEQVLIWLLYHMKLFILQFISVFHAIIGHDI